MGSREVARGPVADRVAENIRALRETRNRTQQQLADALGAVGRPMLASGVSKIEKGERRVDVDDLVAFALALDVTPNRLLLTGAAENDHKVALTVTEAATESWAWRWAAEGEMPLGHWPPTSGGSTVNAAGAKRRLRFRAENRPDRREVSLAELAPYRREVAQAARSVVRLEEKSGLPRRSVLDLLPLVIEFSQPAPRKERDDER